MKVFITLILSILISSTTTWSQEKVIEGHSKPGKLNILYLKPTVKLQANFVDANGNRALDAEEQGTLNITVSNTGPGKAYELQFRLRALTKTPYLTLQKTSETINLIKPEESHTLNFPLSAKFDTPDGRVTLRLNAKEKYDAAPAPMDIVIETRAFLPPELVMSDVGINDEKGAYVYGNGNNKIEKGETVEVEATVQNRGQGYGNNVSVNLQIDDPKIFFIGKRQFNLGDLAPAEYRNIKFTITVQSDYTGSNRLPISMQISEARGKYGKKIPLALQLNQTAKRTTELVAEKIEIKGVERRKVEITEAPSLTIDVDMDIPKSRFKNPNAIAIILGIEQYRSIQNVTYAKRDAAVFREYAVNVLGVPDNKNHIYFKTDHAVTKAEFLKLFTGNGWLAKRVQPTSDVYVYYAGHGAPYIKERLPYLIPADGDANYPTQTGFSLNRLYEELAKLNARSVTVFLDACFSGGTRENTMLLAEARPLLIKVTSPALTSEKLVAFSAASGDQISSGYPDKRHGLFTYFLLKGLRGDADKNYDKAITMEELEKYMIDKVKKTAGLLDREQTPQVMGRDKARILVRY